jgi:hypothetical protein
VEFVVGSKSAGYELLRSRLGEFTGFDEDSFLLSRQSFGSWKVGERGIHCQELSVPEEWHNRARNSAWKNGWAETKVTEINRRSGILSHDPDLAVSTDSTCRYGCRGSFRGRIPLGDEGRGSALEVEPLSA